MIDLFWLILAGFGGGILAGILGIGGGIIYVLVLPYALSHAGIPQDQLAQFTIANSIFGILFASLVTSLLNIHHRDFHLKESLYVGLPGAAVSIVTLRWIVVKPWFTVTYFYVFLIFFLLIMLLSLFLKQNRDHEKHRPESTIKLGLSGATGGALSALTGLGGGAVVVPLLTTQLDMGIKKARSISLVMILITSLSLTILNLLIHPGQPALPYQTGYIYFPAAIPLTAGVLIGSPLGSRLGRFFSEDTVKILFGILILIVIMEKLYQLWSILGY